MDPMALLDMERRTGISNKEIEDFANRMDLVRFSTLGSQHAVHVLTGFLFVLFSSVYLGLRGHGADQERYV
jgi:hypothetical protein